MVGRLGVGIHRAGEERDVRGGAGRRMIAAGDSSIDGSGIRVVSVAADERLDVVVAVAGDEGADDRGLVREFCELGEGGAVGDAGQGGTDLAADAADLGGGAHLGIEGFDLGRAAVHEEEVDGFFGEKAVAVGSAGGGQVGQGEAAQRETADAEKLPPIPAGLAETQHAPPPAFITPRGTEKVAGIGGATCRSSGAGRPVRGIGRHAWFFSMCREATKVGR